MPGLPFFEQLACHLKDECVGFYSPVSTVLTPKSIFMGFAKRELLITKKLLETKQFHRMPLIVMRLSFLSFETVL